MKKWRKAFLIIWMLLIPTIYFITVASPEKTGILENMPEFVRQINKFVQPLIKRDASL